MINGDKTVMAAIVVLNTLQMDSSQMDRINRKLQKNKRVLNYVSNQNNA